MNEIPGRPPPPMHLANQRRWRTGSSGRPLTARRGSALGAVARDVLGGAVWAAVTALVSSGRVEAEVGLDADDARQRLDAWRGLAVRLCAAERQQLLLRSVQ